MNRPASQCNDRQILAMLQDELDIQQTNAIAEHVSTCRQCQMRCEELAASPAEWRLVVDALNSPTDLTHFRSASSPNEESLTPCYWDESIVKQLLDPPSHPEMLGRLSRYEIERVIGIGGMGVVFKAYDSELGRPVAIKVLAPFLAGNATAVQRFAREARAAAAVVDQHVVPIHNVEINQPSPFLVMHYVAGESLQERIDRVGQLDLAEILRIGMQVASGLAAAHQQGLVHRDIKPSNILLEATGVERALISDFGLALAADDVQITRTGAFMGTPQYMSPEQARGELVDHKSDLFSLGSVLYTLCTGRPAFRAASTLATMRRITDEQPTPIRQLNPNIPDWLSNIILKLLSKNKQERYSSAQQLADLLARCLAHVQQPTSEPLPLEVAKLSAATSSTTGLARPKVAIAGMALLLLGIIIAVVAWPFLDQQSFTASKEVNPAREDKQSTEVSYVLGHGYSRSNDKILYKDVPIEDLDRYQQDFEQTKERGYQLAKQVDVSSFVALSETYTKDRNQVYLKLVKSGKDFFVTLPEADSKTFKILSNELATDLKHVWWQGQKIPDIDSRSLRIVHDGFVWKDRRGVWFQNYQIKDADPSSFEHLSQHYYRDANRVYWTTRPILEADPLTFRVSGNDLPYGSDRHAVWNREKKLTDVDLSTFSAVHPNIYKDKNGVSANGQTISKARPESFRLLARLDDRLDTALLTDGEQHFIYLSPISGVYQLESSGESLTLTREISRRGIETREEIDQIRVVLDSTGRNTEPVLEEYQSTVDLMLSSHREHLRKAKDILDERKKNLSFERIGVPGNVVAISGDQKTLILWNRPGVAHSIFGTAHAVGPGTAKTTFCLTRVRRLELELRSQPRPLSGGFSRRGSPATVGSCRARMVGGLDLNLGRRTSGTIRRSDRPVEFHRVFQCQRKSNGLDP
ncbi:MAG: DKNYY domain-containing protein [Planctomycetaceae bacterium]|nr:DKNYY domain-containing protein [Planctomycetaceae bacterium]